MTELVWAPFTQDQVDALTRFQQGRWMHPFTCPNRSNYDHADIWGDRGTLVPQQQAMTCVNCGFFQLWVHAYMLEPPPPWYDEMLVKYDPALISPEERSARLLLEDPFAPINPADHPKLFQFETVESCGKGRHRKPRSWWRLW